MLSRVASTTEVTASDRVCSKKVKRSDILKMDRRENNILECGVNGEIELGDIIYLDDDSDEEYIELFGVAPEAEVIVIDDDEEEVSPTPSVAHSEPGEENGDDDNGLHSPNLGIEMFSTAILFENPTWEQLRMVRQKSGREIDVADVYAAAKSIQTLDLRCDDGVYLLINGSRVCMWDSRHTGMCFMDGGLKRKIATESDLIVNVPTEPYTLRELTSIRSSLRHYWRLRNDLEYQREQADIQV